MLCKGACLGPPWRAPSHKAQMPGAMCVGMCHMHHTTHGVRWVGSYTCNQQCWYVRHRLTLPGVV